MKLIIHWNHSWITKNEFKKQIELKLKPKDFIVFYKKKKKKNIKLIRKT